MITVHLFHAGGEREVMLVDGEHRDARAVCWARVNDPASDVYRAGTFDLLSQRYSFDTDASWYEPGRVVEVAA